MPMIEIADKRKSYNERLFQKGIRRWLHLARFHWLRSKCAQYQPHTDLVLELGCFDARSIEYLGAIPRQYYGFDANWEGGLDLAIEKYGKNCGFVFTSCRTPDEMKLPAGDAATLIICLETLEHIPESLLDGYLDKLRSVASGYLFISVPNEKGPLFLLKYLVKRFLLGSAKDYTLSEVVWATLGVSKKVKRNEHKGFDYDDLGRRLRLRFDCIETSGIPFRWLPKSLNTQIGFVLKAKPD